MFLTPVRLDLAWLGWKFAISLPKHLDIGFVYNFYCGMLLLPKRHFWPLLIQLFSEETEWKWTQRGTNVIVRHGELLRKGEK